jgi:hypothetical protein
MMEPQPIPVSSPPGAIVHHNPSPNFTQKSTTTLVNLITLTPHLRRQDRPPTTFRLPRLDVQNPRDGLMAVTTRHPMVAPVWHRVPTNRPSYSRSTVPRSTSGARPPNGGTTVVCRRAEVSCQKKSALNLGPDHGYQGILEASP